MRRFDLCKLALCALLAAACPAGRSFAAEPAADDTAIDLIVGLLGEQDRDMRALGFQQIREEVPGKAATQKFAALLPKLPADVQSGLLEALGDRGDATARPAVLQMLESKEPAVRASAIKALGLLGSTAEVPLLAQKAAAGSDAEKKAARQSLVRLRGEGINAAIVAALGGGEPQIRAVLLGALASRNATEALPSVLRSAEDKDATVRLAAVGALRMLAGDKEAPALVAAVKAAKDDAERLKVELALLALASRERQKIGAAILAGLASADAPARAALLRVLGRIGGEKALETIAARLKDDDESVRDEAARLLSAWPDAAVVPRLTAPAKGDNLRHRVLAIRGLVRLAAPQKTKPVDVPLLAEAMKAAQRPQEKRLVLGVLGAAAAPQAFALAAAALDDPAVGEEAALAAVAIAEKMKDGKGEVRAALEKVVEQTKNAETRQRAQKVLESL